MFDAVVATHEALAGNEKVLESAHSALNNFLKGTDAQSFLSVLCTRKDAKAAHIVATLRALLSAGNGMSAQAIDDILGKATLMMRSSREFACSSAHIDNAALYVSALLVDKKHLPVDTMLSWATDDHVVVRAFANALWSMVCTRASYSDESALMAVIAEAAASAGYAESARRIVQASSSDENNSLRDAFLRSADPQSDVFKLARLFGDLSAVVSRGAKEAGFRALMRASGNPLGLIQQKMEEARFASVAYLSC